MTLAAEVMLATEVLPSAAIDMLLAFYARGATGQFIVHVKEGKPMVSETVDKKQVRLDNKLI